MPPVPRNLRYESCDTIRSPRRRYKRQSQSDMAPSPKKLRYESRDTICSPRRRYRKQSQSNVPTSPRKFRYERSSSTLNTPTYWTKAYPSISWKPIAEASVPNKMRVHKLPKQTEDEEVKLQTQRSREIQTECTPLYAFQEERVIQAECTPHYAFQEKCKENPSSVCEVNIPSSSHTADNKPPKKLNNYILTPLSISKRKLSMNSELEMGVLNNVVREVRKKVKEVLNGYDPNQLLSSLTRNITRKCIKKKFTLNKILKDSFNIILSFHM